MCQTNFPCYFWNTMLRATPTVASVTVRHRRGPRGSHVNAVLIGTETQLLNLFVAFLMMFFLYVTIIRVRQCQLLKGITQQSLLKGSAEAGRLASRCPGWKGAPGDDKPSRDCSVLCPKHLRSHFLVRWLHLCGGGRLDDIVRF